MAFALGCCIASRDVFNSLRSLGGMAFKIPIHFEHAKGSQKIAGIWACFLAKTSFLHNLHVLSEPRIAAAEHGLTVDGTRPAIKT
jgi:hypothetical protein